MIGIFDSGSGGLTFLAAMKHRYPSWSYLYYADYEHCPFGDRSPDEIQTLTTRGVKKLFDAGASIVVLACNTASAWTLRKLQTEIFPDKKILSVTIPGAEKVVELGHKHVDVFATEQTVRSRTYSDRMKILDTQVHVSEIAFSGDLVRDIESLLPIKQCSNEMEFQNLFQLYTPDGWECDTPEWRALTERYFGRIASCHSNDTCTSQCSSLHRSLFHSDDAYEDISLPESIILGCTHYAYLRKPLQRLFPSSIIIDPSEESARKFKKYIDKHGIQIFSGEKIVFMNL